MHPLGGEGTNLRGRTILGVFAHPDDESLACGGTIACLSDLGASVVLICASHGERGGADGLGEGPSLGTERIRELEAAAETLGVSHLVVLNHPDGNLRWSDVTAFQAEISMTVRRHAPAAVLTFGDDGLYWHVDHIGVHERTTAALRSLGGEAPPLYYATMPRGTMRPIVDAAKSRGWVAPEKGFWNLTPDAFGLHARTPTVVMDVRKWVGRKVAAIRCHRSQIGAADPFGQIDEQHAAQWLGTEHFHRAPIGPSGPEVLELLEAHAP